MKTTTAQSYRVLLADDQADIRDSLRLLLKTEGYETQGVASPTEAINAIEAREFDAVLMDLNYARDTRSEEHTSELQSRLHLVCRLLLEKKKYHCQKCRSLRAWPFGLQTTGKVLQPLRAHASRHAHIPGCFSHLCPYAETSCRYGFQDAR